MLKFHLQSPLGSSELHGCTRAAAAAGRKVLKNWNSLACKLFAAEKTETFFQSRSPNLTVFSPVTPGGWAKRKHTVKKREHTNSGKDEKKISIYLPSNFSTGIKDFQITSFAMVKKKVSERAHEEKKGEQRQQRSEKSPRELCSNLPTSTHGESTKAAPSRATRVWLPGTSSLVKFSLRFFLLKKTNLSVYAAGSDKKRCK